MTTTIKLPLRPFTLITGLKMAGQAIALHELWRDISEGAVKFSADAKRNINEYRNLLAKSKNLRIAPQLQLSWLPDALAEQLSGWLKLTIPGAPSFEGPHRGSPYISAWPIILCGLAARPGDFFYAEAPELFLHPRGQTIIGDFLCRVAAAGVNVIVETQSDHIFNAMRLAVKKQMLSHSDVNVYFFSYQEESLQRSLSQAYCSHRAMETEEHVGGDCYSAELLQIDENGRFPHWPVGFFDEWDHSLDALLSFKQGLAKTEER